MDLLSFFRKEEPPRTPRCNWCKRETDDLPFTKSFKGQEYSFCSEECRRKFRIAYNKRAKAKTCSSCLLKKIR